jgi:hypothetical protein
LWMRGDGIWKHLEQIPYCFSRNKAPDEPVFFRISLRT